MSWYNPYMVHKKGATYITEACQNPRYTLTRTINSRDEIHPWSNPIERPHNGELKAIFRTLGYYNHFQEN